MGKNYAIVTKEKEHEINGLIISLDMSYKLATSQLCLLSSVLQGK